MRLLTCAAALLLAACATQAKFEAMVASFMGHSEGELVSQWGPPQNAYTLNDGSKVLQYSRSGQAFIPGYQQSHTTFYGNQAITNTYGSPGVMINQSCVVNFTVDRTATVILWNAHGNACRAR